MHVWLVSKPASQSHELVKSLLLLSPWRVAHLTTELFLFAVGVPDGFFYLSPFTFSFSKKEKTVSLCFFLP